MQPIRMPLHPEHIIRGRLSEWRREAEYRYANKVMDGNVHDAKMFAVTKPGMGKRLTRSEPSHALLLREWISEL
jgi:hypothetical protein